MTPRHEGQGRAEAGADHYDGTLIVVSHDRDFLTELTELVYEVTPTGLRQYIGDIQQFLVEKRSDTIAAYEASAATAGRRPRRRTKGKAKAEGKTESKEQGHAYADQGIRKLKNRISKLEKQIAELEDQEKALNEDGRARPDGQMATVEKAYEFEKVQTRCRSAERLGVHHQRAGDPRIRQLIGGRSWRPSSGASSRDHRHVLGQVTLKLLELARPRMGEPSDLACKAWQEGSRSCWR